MISIIQENKYTFVMLLCKFINTKLCNLSFIYQVNSSKSHVNMKVNTYDTTCKGVKSNFISFNTNLCYTSDRSGVKEPDNVEKIQDAILGAFKRYVSENRPHQPLHWAKILMKVTDLRTISTRHAERVLCIRLDNSGEIPPLLLEVFNEGHSS